MNRIRVQFLGICVVFGLVAGFQAAQAQQTGNVIFFHPDGASLSHWNALRLYKYGPDGASHWDRLSAMAIYTGHMKDSLTATSHGGATTHAYGVKVMADSFGLDGEAEIEAASGKNMSIMEEAVAAGKATGLIQTGHIAEPGTAAFVASVAKRSNYCEIARQVILSGVQVIMAGGEDYLRRTEHAEQGKCRVEEDLIEKAKSLGYKVIFTREELLRPETRQAEKLLGIFARTNTYNAKPEEDNRKEKVGHYVPQTPSIAEMSEVALSILARSPNGFFLVAEEEGTDNFGNTNNASGQLEALDRADEAVGVFRDFVARNANTLLLMAADSEAGGLHVLGPTVKHMKADAKLPERDDNGAPYDGCDGKGSMPFMSARRTDGTVKLPTAPAECAPGGRAEAFAARQQFPFAIAWASRHDVYGSILARGEGFNAGLVKGKVDNTDIYKIMYKTLFGVPIP